MRHKKHKNLYNLWHKTYHNDQQEIEYIKRNYNNPGTVRIVSYQQLLF